MHPEEKFLGMLIRMKTQGEKIPLDMLTKAEQLGLLLTELDEPEFTKTEEGDDS